MNTGMNIDRHPEPGDRRASQQATLPPLIIEWLCGPVSTMRTPIDGSHFFAGQGALSAVYPAYISESAMQSCRKMAPSLRVGSPMRPSGVAHRLFGATKLRSVRLAWPHWRANAGYPHSVNRPSYGSRIHGLNGTTICFFDRNSRRSLAREVGSVVVRRLADLMDAYLVLSGDSVGRNYKPLPRR